MPLVTDRHPTPSDPSDQSAQVTALTIVGLTLLAPILGGSTQLWAQAIIAVLTGAFFLARPPRHVPGRIPTLLLIALALVPLTAFLPASWLGQADWRTGFAHLGIELPSTFSPQPWLTFESCCLLWLGLAWAYYVLSFEWPAGARERAWDLYCLGILGLAAVLTVTYATKTRIPLWPAVPEFGFFPNRNQTANVLALGGIIMYANAFQYLQRSRNTGWFWLLGLALVCWALILNYSRAGIILFFGGAFAWHLWWSIRARENARPGLAFGPIAILLILFLVVGGETLLRFTKESTEALTMPMQGGRAAIQRDALELLKQSPILGVGLGNFRAIFSVHRQFYLASNEAIHPESDWLWIGTEAGAGMALLFMAMFAWWLRRCFPFDAGSWRRLRMAATIAGCAFAVHGFFDVSGHRPGAIWPALFLASTAIHPGLLRTVSTLGPIMFRLLGLMFLALGSWWAAAIAGLNVPLPNSATLHRAFVDIDRAAAHEDYPAMLQKSSEALQITPLNWELYYKRGYAEAGLLRPRSEILRDFGAARFLLPNWPDLYSKEGRVWLAIGEPDLAFAVWRDGMTKLGSEVRPFYADLYPLVKNEPNLRERWRALGEMRKDCVLIFLQNATPTEFRIELDRILGENPELRGFTPAELKTLFDVWYQKGEKLALAETLRAHPNWQQIGWRDLALVYADYQDYRQAYETVKRFTPAPTLQLPVNESVEALASRFRVTDNDRDGLILAMAEANGNQIDDALAVLTVLLSRAHPAPLAYYMEADLRARNAEWPKAWQAIWKYAEQWKR